LQFKQVFPIFRWLIIGSDELTVQRGQVDKAVGAGDDGFAIIDQVADMQGTLGTIGALGKGLALKGGYLCDGNGSGHGESSYG
jgi:hypothetical protein